MQYVSRYKFPFLCLSLGYWLKTRGKGFRPRKRIASCPPEATEHKERDTPMDIRRKNQLISGGAQDHHGQVMIAPMIGFDLNKTIFGSVEGKLERTILHDRLAVEFYWCDHKIIQTNQAFSRIPALPSPPNALVSFMNEDCDFAMEHADGSYLHMSIYILVSLLRFIYVPLYPFFFVCFC